MGWREVLEDWVHRWCDAPGQLANRAKEDLALTLTAMPAPDRIALARELLAGTGREATHDDAPCQMTGEQADAWASGYNAARAAMLGDEG